MSSWSCRYESSGICRKVNGAYCRPGMKGCVLVGKVKFEDGVVPAPVWPEDSSRTRRGPDELAATSEVDAQDRDR